MLAYEQSVCQMVSRMLTPNSRLTYFIFTVLASTVSRRIFIFIRGLDNVCMIALTRADIVQVIGAMRVISIRIPRHSLTISPAGTELTDDRRPTRWLIK